MNVRKCIFCFRGRSLNFRWNFWILSGKLLGCHQSFLFLIESSVNFQASSLNFREWFQNIQMGHLCAIFPRWNSNFRKSFFLFLGKLTKNLKKLQKLLERFWGRLFLFRQILISWSARNVFRNFRIDPWVFEDVLWTPRNFNLICPKFH